jgi:uncharacterized protein involved in type VI secretion and phage assembly
MTEALLDNLTGTQGGAHGAGFAIAPAVVTNNLDVLGEGRVQVRIPSRPAFEPWARVMAVGGASSRGLQWIPQVGDEVLVAFAEDDLSNAFVLGGLWSTVNRPPLTLPTDYLVKKVIKTGEKAGLGHEVEFDDLKKSITITTSTQQKVTIDPLKMELKNAAGTVTVTLDNATQSVKIEAAAKIELSAAVIQMSALTSIDIKAPQVSVNSAGPCVIQGLPIKLN